MPPEDSRLWYFVPRAVQQGEDWVCDDTRQWFDDKGRKVPISRKYPDHPRWLSGAAAQTKRGSLHNVAIVSEVHILARIFAGLPVYPAWVPIRNNVKQVQAGVAYTLAKLTQKSLIMHGKAAMDDFATRSPAQFIKFVAGAFVPKQLEVAQVPGETMDSETADALLAALAAEVKRRADEAQFELAAGANDWQDMPDAMPVLIEHAKELYVASNTKSVFGRGDLQLPVSEAMYPASKIGSQEIVDIINAEAPDEECIEWD